MKKKILALTLALCMLIPSGITALAADIEVRVVTYTLVGCSNPVSFNTIDGFSSGDVTLELDLNKNQHLDGLTISIGSGSNFSLSGGRQAVTEGSDFTVNGSKLELNLRYSGSGNQLALVFSGTNAAGDSFFGSQSVYINEAINSSDAQRSTEPAGEPLIVTTGDMPKLTAGATENLKFTIQDKSADSAFNISLTITQPEIIFQQDTLITSLDIGHLYSYAKRDVSVKLKMLDTVKSGYYTLNLEYKFVNADGYGYTQTQPINVYVTNPNDNNASGAKAPLLYVAGATSDTASPSDEGAVTLTIDVGNKGALASGEALVTLSGFSADSLSLGETIPTKRIAAVSAGGKSSVEYKLKVSPKLPSGSYPLSVQVEWKEAGETKTAVETVYLTIIRTSAPNADDKPALAVTAMSQDKTLPDADNVVSVTLTIKNIGAVLVGGATLSLDGLSNSGFTIAGGKLNSFSIPDLSSGSECKVTVPLYVNPDMAGGNYPIPVTLTYDDGSDSPVVTRSDIYVFLSRPAKPGEGTGVEHTPRVILSQYSVSKETIAAGEAFTLDFTLKNTSVDKDTVNMKITVYSNEGIFQPVSGSNSFYVTELAFGATSDFSIELIPKRDAETKSYPVVIQIEYEDKAGKPYNVNENLSLPVVQPQRLEIGAFNYYPYGMNPSNISFQYVNKGRSTLYNLTVSVEGPFMLQNGPVFIGNVAQSNNDYFNDMVIPTEYGQLEGMVVFTFEDAVGNEKRIEYPFVGFVEEINYEGDDKFPEDPFEPFPPIEEEGDGLGGWLWVIIGGGALVVLVGLIVTVKVVKKKKMNKYLAQFEDEDGDFLESKDMNKSDSGNEKV